jgi:uncharacterized protein (TIGR02302 family)
LLERKVRTAGLMLLFEKLWPRVWLPAGIAGVFVLLSVFEVWPLLPPRVHSALLFFFGVGFAASFLPLLFWRSPERKASLARLEQASALEHRPLTAFNDTLLQENPPPETLALWEAHRARAARTLKHLKAGAPHARTDKYDPFAFRAVLVLMLVTVGIWAWGDIGARLSAAFAVPDAPAGSGFRIDAWISPPAYTRKEPFVLPDMMSKSSEPIGVPQGSLITVKINGPDAVGYRVTLQEGAKTLTLEPSSQASGTYAEYTRKLEKSATLSIHRGFGARRTWALSAIQDLPPKIAFTGPVEVSPRGAMLFKYKVEDDYGVIAAEARVERVPTAVGAKQPAPQIGKPPVFPLSLPRAPVKAAETKTYRDLTAHPWAGLPVVVTLVARDEAGHESFSAPRGVILPERKFNKPLAKEIAAQRRLLVEEPGDRFRIAGNLNALAINGADEAIPSEIYLNLRSAYWRLRGRPSSEDIESVADQLWDAAVRIEDGNLSAAERDLRAAQDRLKDALERGASPEEIQSLMAELRQALNRYVQALMQQQKPGKTSPATASPDAKTISPQDLEKMLSKIESLARTGSPEAAAQMLNELRDILESVQTGQQERNAQDRENAEKLKQLDRLTDIMRQQQQILDKTFRAQQQGGDSGQGSQQQGSGENKTASGLKKRQEDVKKELQDLLAGMKPDAGGETVQQKLKDAGAEMGEAENALDQNDLGEAGDQESRALESMRQGTRSIAEQMARAAGQGTGSNQTSRDPLGRRQDGQLLDTGDSVKVPDEITVQQARRILDELRKRLGEPARPAIELDYLERLVKPY